MTMTLRLSPEQDAALARLAKRQGVSKNEAAAQAIVDRDSRLNREGLLEAALSDTMSRYASTLKRLGE